MKGLYVSGMVAVCLSIVSLSAYQISEPGMFASIAQDLQGGCVNCIDPHKSRQVAAQATRKGPITIINGFDQFNKHVVKASLTKPVVVKVHSIHSSDSRAIRQPFLDVAHALNSKVSFVSLDIFRQHAGAQENYQLIAKLMTTMGVFRIDLPLMLFFKDGALCCPADGSGAMLQGLYTKDELSQLVQKKFFPPPGLVTSKPQIIKPSASPVRRMSLTTTTTSGSTLPRKKPLREKPEGRLRGWWGRIKKIFKRSK